MCMREWIHCKVSKPTTKKRAMKPNEWIARMQLKVRESINYHWPIHSSIHSFIYITMYTSKQKVKVLVDKLF